MGRQVRFYVLPSDANALVDRLRSRLGTKVLVDYSPEYELFEVEAPYRETSSETLEPVGTSNRFYLATEPSRLFRKFYPKPNWWVVDSDSEGIEFEGCTFDGITLFEGRLWYRIDFVRDLQLVSKGVDFLKWAEAVYRCAKQFLRYVRGIDAYVGEDAFRFYQNGGKFDSSISPGGKVIQV